MERPFACSSCGAALSAADFERPECPYCRAAYPEYVRRRFAAETAAQLMGDGNDNGIPDAVEPWLQAQQATQSIGTGSTSTAGAAITGIMLLLFFGFMGVVTLIILLCIFLLA